MSRESPYRDDNRPPKVFTLASSGEVVLFGPEIDIVNSAEFQRLASIKQLGTSYFVFRGAVHSRFEHSLGAVHIAQRIIDVVNRNPHAATRVTKRQARLIRLFALLHDLPHIPFGHTLEDEFALLQRHDKNPDRIERLLWKSPIGTILAKALEPEEVATLRRISSRGEESEALRRAPMPFASTSSPTPCARTPLTTCTRHGGVRHAGRARRTVPRVLRHHGASDVPVPTNRNRMALGWRSAACRDRTSRARS